MRKRLISCVWILAVFLLTVGCGTTASTEQHKPTSPSNPLPSKRPNPSRSSNQSTDTGTNIWPENVAFWNANDGLLVAVKGHSNQEGFIERTHDGGKTWQVVYHGGKNIGQLSVDNNGDAWATVRLTGDFTKALKVIYSSDQGTTWETLNNGIPYERFFKGVGWGWKGETLYKTTDQGHSWTSFSPPDIGGKWEGYTAWFASPSNGWLLKTTQGGAGRMGKQIDETTDGGRSWDTVVNVPFMSNNTVKGLNSNGYPSDVFFFPDGHGWMWETRGNLYLTSDGGHQWSASPSTEPDGKEVESAWFITENKGFALFNTVSNSGHDIDLQTTDDGGRTWHIIKTWPQS